MRRLRLKKNNVLKKITFLTILLILIIATVIIFQSPVFKINSVEVKFVNTTCGDQNSIREKSGFIGRNIFLANEKIVNKNLKSNFICLKSINFKRSLPNKIIIEAKGREAVAQILSVKGFEASTSSFIENIATSSGSEISETFLIDEEGIIYSKGDYQVLPRVNIFSKTISIGSNLDDKYLTKTLSILKVLKRSGFENTQVNLVNNFLITQTSPKIIFKLDQDESIQIASLQLILQKAKIDDSKLDLIDLRFDKPIVKFAPKKNG